MSVKEIIKKRRSIRKYQNKEIPDALIKELIEAARLAPSGNNAQPSKFLIVKEEPIKQRLKENQIFKQDFVYKAPLIIVCCGDPEAYPKARFEQDYDESSYEVRAIRDLSIATQNLVLRATELGLGTCYVGWLEKEKIKELLNIPRNYSVPFVITLGCPAEKPKPTPRKDIKEFLF